MKHSEERAVTWGMYDLMPNLKRNNLVTLIKEEFPELLLNALGGAEKLAKMPPVRFRCQTEIKNYLLTRFEDHTAPIVWGYGPFNKPAISICLRGRDPETNELLTATHTFAKREDDRWRWIEGETTSWTIPFLCKSSNGCEECFGNSNTKEARDQTFNVDLKNILNGGVWEGKKYCGRKIQDLRLITQEELNILNAPDEIHTASSTIQDQDPSVTKPSFWTQAQTTVTNFYNTQPLTTLVLTGAASALLTGYAVYLLASTDDLQLESECDASSLFSPNGCQ